MKKAVVLLLLLAVAGTAASSAAQTGVKKKRPLPGEYGRVIINNNNSERYGLAPVVFDHWLHRTKATCRVCHVDIGFAMKAGATGIRADDNMRGYYCGVCHNGKTFRGKKMFESCDRGLALEHVTRCDLCHSYGKNVKKENDFAAITGKFPPARFGNAVNWVQAESDGLVKPANHLEGVSGRKSSLPVQKDFLLNPKVEGMPDIIFSHTKHTVWNGCEVCHPEIFVGVKKGLTKYSMPEIFEGKYCGVCHGKVAFPLMDCERCHIKPVQ